MSEQDELPEADLVDVLGPALVDTLLALADDFLTEHPDGEPVDPDDVYDWLVAQAHKLGTPAAEPATRPDGR